MSAVGSAGLRDGTLLSAFPGRVAGKGPEPPVVRGGTCAALGSATARGGPSLTTSQRLPDGALRAPAFFLEVFFT